MVVSLYRKKHSMSNTQLIQHFYTAFSQGNAEEMAACYHPDIVFADPAFGTLEGERARAMWRMLLSRKEASPAITFHDIAADETSGSAHWVAEYHFGPKKRKVINHVSAAFSFRDGKIIRHTDTFNLWKWSQQALGPVGYVIGWTPYMKKSIQRMTNKRLDAFLAKR